MEKRKLPMISDLSEEDRKLAIAQTERLLTQLKECEVYLRDYKEGTQTLYKFIGDIAITQWTMSEVQTELLDIHKVPKKDGVYGLDPL